LMTSLGNKTKAEQQPVMAPWVFIKTKKMRHVFVFVFVYADG
jgi:hypothetical protein